MKARVTTISSKQHWRYLLSLTTGILKKIVDSALGIDQGLLRNTTQARKLITKYVIAIWMPRSGNTAWMRPCATDDWSVLWMSETAYQHHISLTHLAMEGWPNPRVQEIKLRKPHSWCHCAQQIRLKPYQAFGKELEHDCSELLEEIQWKGKEDEREEGLWVWVYCACRTTVFPGEPCSPNPKVAGKGP